MTIIESTFIRGNISVHLYSPPTKYPAQLTFHNRTQQNTATPHNRPSQLQDRRPKTTVIRIDQANHKKEPYPKACRRVGQSHLPNNNK